MKSGSTIFRDSFITLVALLIAAIGIALSIKADIGISAYDGFNVLIADLLHLKVGTMMIWANSSLIIVQALLLRKKFHWSRFLQLIPILTTGYIVNFILYTWLGNVTIPTYWLQIVVFIIGQIICAYSIGWLLALAITSFSLEPTLLEVASLTGIKFHILRQALDIALIILNLFICFILNQPTVVREGTLIGMIIFTPILNFSLHHAKHLLKKDAL